MNDDIKEKSLRGKKCTTVLHGGVCHRTSTPHKSENKMKRKKVIKVNISENTSNAENDEHCV